MEDDRGGAASVTFAWTIEERNIVPTLDDPGPQTTDQGTEVSLQLIASDGNGDPLIFSAQGLPAGLAIDPDSGLISGQPTTPQTTDVTARVEDDRGASASVTFTWTVREPNVAPTLDDPGPQSGEEGTSVSLQLIANDGNGDPLTFSAQGLPSGLAIDPASGLISGTPTQEQTSSVTASVDDGRGGSASVTFTWVIDERNLAPTLQDPGDQLTVEGTPVSLGLVASDPNGDPLTFSASGLPTGLAIDPQSGLISGVPTLPQVTTVVATVEDGRGGSASVSFLWVVEDINVDPTLENPGAQVTIVGTPVALQMVASDGNGDALSFGAKGLPAGLAIDRQSGLISGVPTTVQSTNVTVTVVDGRGGSALVRFTWSIEPVPNEAPTLEDPGPQTSNVGASVTLQLIADDANGDPLTYSAQGLPDGLTIDTGTGLISGVPTTEQVREVTATVDDGQGADASVTFTWTVEQAFDERLVTEPFTLPASGGRATQEVDLSNLGVLPGDLVRVSNVRALGDLDDGGETFQLNFNGGDPLSLDLASGVECSTRLDGVIPDLDVWVAVVDLGGGTPGIAIEGITDSNVGGFCDPIDGGSDVAVQYVLEVERGTALRSPVRELPEDGGSTTHVVDLSALGIAVGDSVQVSDVRAQGDLNSDNEVFSLSFNDGSAIAEDLTVPEECARRLDPVTVPVASTVQAIDIGGGTPGVSVTGTTDGSVGGFCDPIGSGDDIAVEYTLVGAVSNTVRTPPTELPPNGGNETLRVDLSGLDVAVNDQVNLIDVRARGDLDGGNENFDLEFNSGELRLNDLTVIGECVGLESVEDLAPESVTVIDIGSGVPGVIVTATSSGAVDRLCTPPGSGGDDDDDDDDPVDSIALEFTIELKRQ